MCVVLSSQQNCVESTEISHLPTYTLHICVASPMINISHQRGTFFTTDEPTLVHHNHPKSRVYIRVHSWSWVLYGFGQNVITCICHYDIMQSIFTALKILCAQPIHFPQPLNTWQTLVFLMCP